MKKNILALVLLFIMVNTYSQMHISTNMRENFVFNDNNNKYELLNSDENELTFFEFNKEFTMFKHTTPSITSAYNIKTSKEDKENNRWEFEILSDVGNSYLMILDIANKNIRFIYEKDGKTYSIRHSIKKIWFDEN